MVALPSFKLPQFSLFHDLVVLFVVSTISRESYRWNSLLHLLRLDSFNVWKQLFVFYELVLNQWYTFKINKSLCIRVSPRNLSKVRTNIKIKKNVSIQKGKLLDIVSIVCYDVPPPIWQGIYIIPLLQKSSDLDRRKSSTANFVSSAVLKTLLARWCWSDRKTW